VTRLLVVAHQTATSPSLMRRLTALAQRDRSLRVSIVVPQTAVNRLPQRKRAPRTASQAAAATARRAARVYSNERITVEGASVGDLDPVAAARRVEARQGPFDAILLSTLAPGESVWLEFDAPRRLRETALAPVIVAHEANEAEWPSVLATLEEQSGGKGAWVPVPVGVGTGIKLWHIALAMSFYIAGTLSLMVLVDRRFILNDIVAVALFGLILGWLALDERRRRGRDPRRR
jgi:hypothetical protein